MKKIFLLLCVVLLVGCAVVVEERESVLVAEPVFIGEAAPTPETTPTPEATPAPVDASLATDTPPDDALYEAVEYLLSQMTVEEKIGQLFMLRLPWQSLYVNAGTLALFEAIPMGGVIIFGDNVASREQLTALTSDLQELSRLPLLIAIDEEGGRVSRAGRLFADGVTPSAYEIGAALYPSVAAFETGLLIGRELVQLGFNMNFAPVADIWSNPANEVIGRRAFGRDAEVVVPLVEAFTLGLHEGGVMAVAKHFPGHGDTYEDSHYALAVFHGDWTRWQMLEGMPFASGINAGVYGVMMGHIATPEITGDYLPATLSNFWHMTLRDMGFDGLIITDALEMRALTDHFTCGQIATMAFLAGADILLMPHREQQAFDAMLQAFEDGIFTEARLDESVRRILRLSF
ncbi:MAG: glycoside hydrolase family 3 protein [Defluviitaleaceae bacterium]|nr:glycoside hydrolase family 3 protein [Defluviitaleaceae bacterium]